MADKQLWGIGDFAGAVTATVTKSVPGSTLTALAIDINAMSGQVYQPICRGGGTNTTETFFGAAETGVFGYLLLCR